MMLLHSFLFLFDFDKCFYFL